MLYTVSQTSWQDWIPGAHSGRLLIITPFIGFPILLLLSYFSILPGVTSQINYLCPNPHLKNCFGRNQIKASAIPGALSPLAPQLTS